MAVAMFSCIIVSRVAKNCAMMSEESEKEKIKLDSV